MNEIFDDLFAHEVFEDDHGIDPLEMNGNDFFDPLDDNHVTENEFFDASDDVLEMNPNPDDFYKVLNLYQDDPLDDPENFLEINEIFDDLFAHEVFEDDHGI